MPLQDALDYVKKMNKAKLVLGVSIAAAAFYLFLRMHQGPIQRTVSDVSESYIQNQPQDLCITSLNVDHQVFPPRYGISIDYKPCRKDMPGVDQTGGNGGNGNEMSF